MKLEITIRMICNCKHDRTTPNSIQIVRAVGSAHDRAMTSYYLISTLYNISKYSKHHILAWYWYAMLTRVVCVTCHVSSTMCHVAPPYDSGYPLIAK